MSPDLTPAEHAADGANSYLLAVNCIRHEMLTAGDAWAHEDETVDIHILWLIGRHA